MSTYKYKINPIEYEDNLLYIMNLL